MEHRAKTFRKYSAENMALAIRAVRGGMPKMRAAKQFAVPRTSLLDKLSGSPEVGYELKI